MDQRTGPRCPVFHNQAVFVCLASATGEEGGRGADGNDCRSRLSEDPVTSGLVVAPVPGDGRCRWKNRNGSPARLRTAIQGGGECEDEQPGYFLDVRSARSGFARRSFTCRSHGPALYVFAVCVRNPVVAFPPGYHQASGDFLCHICLGHRRCSRKGEAETRKAGDPARPVGAHAQEEMHVPLYFQQVDRLLIMKFPENTWSAQICQIFDESIIP